ncbi:MAG: PAS domain-containing protein, partial [Flavobacteriales bacterium]
MEGSLNLLVWFSLTVLLLCSVGLVFAYNRLRERLEQEERKRAGIERIVDQANDAIIVLDFVSGRIYHANPSAAEMLGTTVEEMQGMTVFDLHFPEDLHRSAERIADVWSNGGLV